jgi:hypothetical protein
MFFFFYTSSVQLLFPAQQIRPAFVFLGSLVPQYKQQLQHDSICVQSGKLAGDNELVLFVHLSSTIIILCHARTDNTLHCSKWKVQTFCLG